MCELPRLRTISRAHMFIVEQDPDTDITEAIIRRLVAEGEIPCVRQGKKSLVNIDTLTDDIANYVARMAEQREQVTAPKPKRKEATCKLYSGNYGNVRAI